MKICCYDFLVSEGQLTIESSTVNTILGPFFDIPLGSSLILKGNTVFAGGGSVSGNIQGQLVITDSLTENPSITGTFFFDAEGEIILDNVTFQGDGFFHGRINTFLPENSTVTFDGPRFSNQRILETSPLSTIILKNGGRLLNSNYAEMILNGGSIIGINYELFSNGGLIKIINNSEFNLNGINFRNTNILNLGQGSFIMDDNSGFENYYYFDPEYPEFVDYGEIIGAGYFKFPTYNSETINNNGIFSPGPGVNTMNTENFSQKVSGITQIEIENISNYDTIINIGTTYFEGEFEVMLGFSPIIGDEFIVYQSDTPLTICNPISTTSASYNNLNYVFDVICNFDNITLKLSEILTTNEFDLNDYKFYISPNPVRDKLNIIIQDVSIIYSIKIYNVLGKIVLEEKKKVNQIDVSNLKSGLLFLKIETDRGFITKKIIKE